METLCLVFLCLAFIFVGFIVPIIYLFREVYRIGTVRILLESLSKSLVIAHLMRNGRIDASIDCIDAVMEQYFDALVKYRGRYKQEEMIEVIDLFERYKVIYSVENERKSIRPNG